MTGMNTRAEQFAHSSTGHLSGKPFAPTATETICEPTGWLSPHPSQRRR
jgi:hypothetical protein